MPGEFTPERMSAIGIANSLGYHIKEKHPEIVEMYRSGMTKLKIGEVIGLTSRFKSSIIKTAIYFALSGNQVKIRGRIFTGLIKNPSELEELCKSHQSASGRKYGSINGKNTYDEGSGLFGMSEQDRAEVCSKGGYASVVVQMDQGIGIFGRSDEQIYVDSQKGAEARGFRTWKLDVGGGQSEIELAYSMSLEPRYRMSRGTNNQ